jgi:HEAT repeat protein/cyclophilin family peptidyl-prolyl cis-trans isomerase
VCGLVVAAGLAVLAAAAAGAQDRRRSEVAAPQPLVTFEDKMAWILMLEDTRALQAPAPVPVPLPEPAPTKRGRTGPVTAPAPPPAPDLLRLLTDTEARIRRRAALAVGRVGLADGIVPLARLLAQDPEAEVRQMAAFGMGLIGSRAAGDFLRAALADPSPLVQGRAAEALAAIGDADAAPLIARMTSTHAKSPQLAALPADELKYPLAPDVEAYRLGLYALTRLKAWETLAQVVLAPDGAPASRWWPVAFALSRLEDPRAVAALVALARAEGSTTRAFAARGLGAQKAASAVPALIALAEGWKSDARAAVQAIRSLAQIGDAGAAAPAMRALLTGKDTDANVRLEAAAALGALRDQASLTVMLDLLADPWPAMRAAALRASQAIDPENFLTVLSGLDVDPNVGVRLAVVSLLGKAVPDVAVPRLTKLLGDKDLRVVPAAIAALAQLKAPEAGPALVKLLGHDDVMVRAAAARAIGELKMPGAEAALAKAYRDGARDAAYSARAAALAGLRQYGAGAAMPVLREALGDKDWAVRVHAASLIRELDPKAETAAAMRPGPGRPPADYARPDLVNPLVSPHVYFETDKGTVEIELFVLDAPQTCDNFLRLARDGYFSGVAIHRVVPNFVVQDGDRRGDGEGGPGYSIRDEINEQPYLRGTVGMALEWADTGGSQWFVTHSPQPHLDGRYTVFGRVVAGMDVVDRLQQWDVIRKVSTWDGVAMTTR